MQDSVQEKGQGGVGGGGKDESDEKTFWDPLKCRCPWKPNKSDPGNGNGSRLISARPTAPNLWEAKSPCFLLYRCLLRLLGGTWASGAQKECIMCAEPWQLRKRRMTLRVSAKQSHRWMACVLDCAQHNACEGTEGGGAALLHDLPFVLGSTSQKQTMIQSILTTHLAKYLK